MSVARVQYGLDMEIGEAKNIHATYQKTYPGVPDYWASQIRKCRELGYAETLAGRRVQLVGRWNRTDSWALESTSINFPIQGIGADQKYLALAVARNELSKWGGYMYFELHDGIYWIFPAAKAEAAAHHFKKILSNLPYKQAWGVDLPIQFPVDAKIGPNWGDLKGV